MFEFIKKRFRRQDANDELELRRHMQETYGGLRADRSTASYALEFLKTERANWKFHANRNATAEEASSSEEIVRVAQPESASVS